MGDDCIFCRIIAGQVPAERVFESAEAIAFLDLMQASRGHTLVVPKVHVPSLPELSDADSAGLFRAVKAVMGKIDRALTPLAFNVGWNHGLAAGQHVFHLHVHVLPRFTPGGMGVQALGISEGGGGDREQLARLGAAIRGA
jgi:histidine triad (HIT) family protein